MIPSGPHFNPIELAARLQRVAIWSELLAEIEIIAKKHKTHIISPSMFPAEEKLLSLREELEGRFRYDEIQRLTQQILKTQQIDAYLNKINKALNLSRKSLKRLIIEQSNTEQYYDLINLFIEVQAKAHRRTKMSLLLVS